MSFTLLTEINDAIDQLNEDTEFLNEVAQDWGFDKIEQLCEVLLNELDDARRLQRQDQRAGGKWHKQVAAGTKDADVDRDREEMAMRRSGIATVPQKGHAIKWPTKNGTMVLIVKGTEKDPQSGQNEIVTVQAANPDKRFNVNPDVLKKFYASKTDTGKVVWEPRKK